MNANKKKWEICDLNCYSIHLLDVANNGGSLVYGTAIGPDGNRYGHCWVERDNVVVDRFGWAEHIKEGEHFSSPSDFREQTKRYINSAKRHLKRCTGTSDLDKI